jgi:nucleotide-binding universal stress UspA family protein
VRETGERAFGTEDDGRHAARGCLNTGLSEEIWVVSEPVDATKGSVPPGDGMLIYLRIARSGMPETILVPIDGSPLAARALRYAVETFPTASVTTIYVINPVDSVFVAETGGLPAADAWYETAQERAAAIHEDARALATEYDAELTTVTEVGRPAREILDYADEHGIDQIVMGSHGRDGIERAILGSVAERVTRSGRQPVTIIR